MSLDNAPNDGATFSVLVLDAANSELGTLFRQQLPHVSVVFIPDLPTLALLPPAGPADLVILDERVEEALPRKVLEQQPTILGARKTIAVVIESNGSGASFLLEPLAKVRRVARDELVALVQLHLALASSSRRIRATSLPFEAPSDTPRRARTLVRDAHLSLVSALLAKRDLGTARHAARTEKYVEVIGEALEHAPRSHQLSTEALLQVSRSALLHDIGKLHIADAVLFKPGPLSRDEYEVMKTHSALGGQAIADAIARVQREAGVLEPSVMDELEFLETAREVATHHHERWDGTGYPDGLRGERIPLSARLVAVADVFDALTTERVYKAPLPAARGVEVIVQGRGTSFDPVLVDAFVAVKEKVLSMQSSFGPLNV